MKTKFLAIGLLGAALAATAVFADDANNAAQATPALNGQQSTNSVDANAAPAATMSGNGQTTAQ